MAKALSRKQKQIANEMQKKMLQPIISYNKLEKLVGSELADGINSLQILSDISKWGVPTKEIGFLSYFASVSARAYISREKLRSEQAPQKEDDTPQLDTNKLYIGQVFKTIMNSVSFLILKSKQVSQDNYRNKCLDVTLTMKSYRTATKLLF